MCHTAAPGAGGTAWRWLPEEQAPGAGYDLEEGLHIPPPISSEDDLSTTGDGSWDSTEPQDSPQPDELPEVCLQCAPTRGPRWDPPGCLKLPGAATHEAPSFQERQAAGRPQRLGSRSPSPERRSPSPERRSLPAVVLQGFKTPGVDGLYVGSPQLLCAINGRETYWSTSGEYFLYHAASTNTWGVAKAKRFSRIRAGQSHGVAHSPTTFDLWHPAALLAKPSWREWDAEEGRWGTRLGSGLASRGRVRRRDPKEERGTQTPRSAAAEQETQTECSRS